MDIQTKSDRPDITPHQQMQFRSSQSESDFLSLLGILPVGCILFDANFRIQYWNTSSERIFGYTAMDVVGKHPSELIFLGELNSQFNQILQGVAEGHDLVCDIGSKKKDGTVHYSSWRFTRLGTETQGLLAIVEDTSGEKRATEKMSRQMERIHALRTIDIAITGNTDFQVTLNVILQQAMLHLKMDAAIILVYDPSILTLKYAAGQGMRTDALRFTTLRIGEEYAGMSVLQRKIIRVSDLQDGQQSFVRSPKFSNEDFKSFYCVPLIAKGEVKGVMESFHRLSFKPDDEWLDFFETLGGQAAIAIDNAMLFKELQRSNLELMLAYDTTLEGWSKALDMRDRDTEGHTRRVTEMTERLAATFNIPENDRINIRRGAILHDIGKMGIPDSILLKEGSLSDEEWKIMRQHPALAMSLLSSISYLRFVLDIPYCHHEKWDGTGYPRGLKGRQIPLAARIFAVADVYDALTSDRPYRRAWSVQQALEYINAERGKHFDPEVVDVFMRKYANGAQ